MRTVIPYGGGEVEVSLEGETWRVRLGELEESSPYLDYALSRLLDAQTRDVHHDELDLRNFVAGRENEPSPHPRGRPRTRRARASRGLRALHISALTDELVHVAVVPVR